MTEPGRPPDVRRLLASDRVPWPTGLERPAAGDGRYGAGSGAVAVDRDLGRRVVVHRSPVPLEGEALQRFLGPARLLARLTHPAIPPVHDAGIDDLGRPFFTTAEAGGRTLDQAAGDLDPAAIHGIVRRIAGALDRAHDLGIAHGRVSAAAIATDDDGGVFLTGWHEASTADDRDGRPVDRASDAAALAAALGQALAGRQPSRRLRAILGRAAAAGYPTAGALADDLLRLEAGQPIEALPEGPLARCLRAARRRPRLATVVVSTALLLAAGALASATISWRDARIAAGRREAQRLRALDDARAALDGDRTDLAAASFRRALELEGGPGDPATRSELAAVHRARATRALERATAGGGTLETVTAAAAEARRALDLETDPTARAALEALLREAEGRIAIAVESRPAGTAFAVHRLPHGAVDPGPVVATGRTPSVVEVPAGGYLLRFEGPVEVRLPVLLRIGQTDNRAIEVEIPRRVADGFVPIPAGAYLAGPDRRPARLEAGFQLQRREVTWAEYEAFLAALDPVDRAARQPVLLQTGQAIPRSMRLPDLPVFSLTRADLAAYAAWLGATDPARDYRLPTADEWEWAARGADGRTYPGGDDWSPGRANLARQDATVVEASGFRTADRSVFGCLEMAGNVGEWALDRAGEFGLLLGGSASVSPFDGRCWSRRPLPPAGRGPGTGGRLVAVGDDR